MTAVYGLSPTADITDVGRAFTRLTLRVAHYVPDSLHGYWGPNEWLEEVAANPPSLEDLRDEAVSVATAVQKSGLPENRREMLQRQTRALLWLIRARMGEQIMFSEQVRLLLDVQPESVDNSVFLNALEGFSTALPPGDNLAQRWVDWQTTHTRPLETIVPQLRHAFACVGHSWSGSNGFDVSVSSRHREVLYQPRKLILPARMSVRVDRLLHQAAQWATMWQMISAAARRFEAGETECAIWLNYGPHQVLARGLARVFLPGSELYDEIIPALLEAAGMSAGAARQLESIHLAEDVLDWVDANVVLMLHGEGLRPRVLRRHFIKDKLMESQMAEERLEYLSDPIRAAHVFAPLIGQPLVKAWLESGKGTIASLIDDPPVPSRMLFEIRFDD